METAIEKKPLLRRLYKNEGEFFLLIRPTAVFIVEAPNQRQVSRESTLHLFTNTADITSYRRQAGHTDTEARKVTLESLWGLLDQINNLSIAQFKAPVRVCVATVDGSGNPIVLDTLHSAFSLPS